MLTTVSTMPIRKKSLDKIVESKIDKLYDFSVLDTSYLFDLKFITGDFKTFQYYVESKMLKDFEILKGFSTKKKKPSIKNH